MNAQTFILKSLCLILLFKSVINLRVGWEYFYETSLEENLFIWRGKKKNKTQPFIVSFPNVPKNKSPTLPPAPPPLYSWEVTEMNVKTLNSHSRPFKV